MALIRKSDIGKKVTIQYRDAPHTTNMRTGTVLHVTNSEVVLLEEPKYGNIESDRFRVRKKDVISVSEHPKPKEMKLDKNADVAGLSQPDHFALLLIIVFGISVFLILIVYASWVIIVIIIILLIIRVLGIWK